MYLISGTNLLNGGSAGTDGESPPADSLPTDNSPPADDSPPTDEPPPTDNPPQTYDPPSTPTPDLPTTPPPTNTTHVNIPDHEDPADYVWNSSTVIDIELNGNSITVSATDVATVVGSKVTITSAGTYRISGSLTDGQVVVDTNDEETVRLILNGVNINCSTSAPVYVMNAEKVVIVLQEGTENYVADGENYPLEAGTDEPNAAVFSKSDLTIYGAGSLSVDGNYNDGIASKDGLIIKGGAISVSAVDDGIRGKDCLVVKGGDLSLTVGDDGLKSDNAEDVARGYVSVEAGVVNVVCGGDAVQASTDVIVTGGEFTLVSGGGSSGVLGADVSAKGLKASVSITIDGGIFVVDSADDAFHSNGNVTINGGVFTMSTGDDAVHANTYLEINGGNITITQCFEGLESNVITINNVYIKINARDDGINVAGGNDGANPMAPPNENQWLHIKGGYIVISSVADGIDVNGHIDMSGGIVLINGPVGTIGGVANGAIDYGLGTFKITGGTLVAVGSSSMAQGPTATSTQYSVLINLNNARDPTLIHLATTSGEVFTFMPTKRFQSIVYSSPQLAPGSYSLYLGGSSTGTPTDGVYEGGTYTPGNKYASFIISKIITTIGGGGWGFP